jgi:hypothetical protein
MRDNVLEVINKHIHNKGMANQITDEVMMAILPDLTDSLFEAVKSIIKVAKEGKNV